MCNAWVKFVLKRDKKKKFRFASLQDFVTSNPEYLNPPVILSEVEIPESVIYIRDKKIYYKSSAALRILSDMGGLYRLFYVLLIFPLFFRNFVYDVISHNRYKMFGKKDSCMIPDQNYKDRFLDTHVTNLHDIS